MTAFDSNFLFLRNPAGGVEDLGAMQAAGFAGVFCNIRDFPAENWSVILTRAKARGMFCGPWARTGQGVGTFDPQWLDWLTHVADAWGNQPLIVNSEKELDGTGSTLTSLIAQKCGTRDYAISMEPWLYPNVDWSPVAYRPMLLQINPAENTPSKDPAGCKGHAHQLGCECVYFTFGTAPPQAPSWYVLQSPYSLYTGDNAGPTFSAWSPTSSGFDACQQPTPPPSPVLTVRQAPYTGPYYGPSDARGPDKGPTAEALKRAVSRLGYIVWTDFDRHYNGRLETAMRAWQRKVGLAPSGQYGKGSWEKMRAAVVPSGQPHAGEPALDYYARTLLQDEAKQTDAGEDEAKVQRFITEFWREAIEHNGIWRYSQNRPFDVSVDPSAGGGSDCSAMIVQARHYAKRKTGLDVPDPAKQNWSGYGNTDLYEDDWPKVHSPYRVGDVAHFHSERHVIECIVPGTIDTAQWASNGREAAPELVRSLRSYSRFPDEFMYVVRPTLVE